MVAPSGKEKKDYYMMEMKKMVQLSVTLSGKSLYFLILPHPRDWVNSEGKWNNGGRWYLHKWNKVDWDEVDDGKWNF